jgi:CRP-like cAMP-binding protein
MTWLSHIANALYLVSYAVKEILWLRLVTVAANIAMLIAFLQIDAPRSLIAWQVLFFAINVVRLAQLVYERKPVPLPAHARRLASATFPSLRPRELLRLLEVGSLVEHALGTTVVRRDEPLDHVSIVVDGTARVQLRDRTVDLAHGAFIGELSYLTGRPPGADVVAATPLRVVRWPCIALREHLAARPETRTAMQLVLGADLATKLRGH